MKFQCVVYMFLTCWVPLVQSFVPLYSGQISKFSLASDLRFRVSSIEKYHAVTSRSSISDPAALFAASGGNYDDESLPVESSSSYVLSLATLMACVWMWALQTPAVRYMYNTVEHAPPIAVLNAASAMSSLIAITTIVFVKELFKGDDLDAAEGPPVLRDEIAQRAGAELGAYKFLGVGFNLLGISLTLSSQAAFCIQLTTIMVPVSQAIMGVKLKPQLWAAVGMALGGVALLTFDGATNIGNARLHDLLLGDGYCVIAAIFYACYDVRVNTWSKVARTLPLTLYKTAFQTLFSCIVLGVLVAAGLPQGQQITDWLSQVSKDEMVLIGGVAIFSGAFANCLATILQVGAQRQVGPSRAQLIYSTNPLWNSLIATFSLGETIRTAGIAGGGLFLSALAIAAITPPEADQSLKAESDMPGISKLD